MIVKKPFVSYTLDEDRKFSDTEVISLKLNLEERARINLLKRVSHYDQDAKVIKFSLIIAEKVILGLFGDELFTKLTSTNRTKPITETSKEVSDFDKK